jgi:hypothetical protein
MTREYDIPPNFIKDLEHGENGEQNIRDFLHDLNSGAIEIKTDRYRNGRVVIETDQNPHKTGWKKSGINVTTATWWVYQYHLDGAFTAIKVDRLKRYLRSNPDRYNEQTKQHFGTRGDNPSKGWILEQHEIYDLLLNPKYDE